MKSKLLGGASAAVLAIALASGALAQDNEAEENLNSTITQNAVDEGALVGGTGNTIGDDAEDIAAAAVKSTAVQINDADAIATNDSAAADDGAVVVGDGVALGVDVNHQAIVGKDGVAIYADEGVSDGSALHIGDQNSSATAEESSAAANANSTAIWANGDIADEGSAVVVGDHNSTAAADDGGASVGGDGTAVSVTDVSVGGGGFFPYEGGNLAVEGVEGGFLGGGDDATLAFGIDNVVASAHLDSTVSGLVVAVDLSGDNENGTEVSTGSIYANGVSSAVGANRVVYNTGIANQGRALAVAGEASFKNNNH